MGSRGEGLHLQAETVRMITVILKDGRRFCEEVDHVDSLDEWLSLCVDHTTRPEIPQTISFDECQSITASDGTDLLAKWRKT
jgi:hypothetical protein